VSDRKSLRENLQGQPSYPIPPALAARSFALCRRFTQELPSCRGYRGSLTAPFTEHNIPETLTSRTICRPAIATEPICVKRHGGSRNAIIARILLEPILDVQASQGSNLKVAQTLNLFWGIHERDLAMSLKP
jgi:hypothetical protein